MMATVLNSTPMDDSIRLGLQDIMQACAQPEDWVIALVQVGILEPLSGQNGPASTWQFAGQALFTARTAWRLQRDLGVNLEGVALALELIAQIDALRARLARDGGEPG